MGLLDDLIAGQSGGGMLGGLPASWQYENPESLSPIQKQMMGLVGTQNPDQAGFNPLPASTDAFPVGGAAPVIGANNPFGMLPPTAPVAPTAPATPPMVFPPVQSLENQGPSAAQGFGMDVPPLQMPPPAPAPVGPAAPTFGAGAAPIFATPPGVPGNPTLPPAAPTTPPVVAQDDGKDDDAPASPIKVGNLQVPRIGPASAFTPDPAALPVNAQPTQGQGLPVPPTSASATLPAAPFAAAGDHLKAAWQSMRHGGGLIGGLSGLVTGQRDDPDADVQQQAAQVANMTARALIAKGVDQNVAIAAVQPGNTEMLKTLIDATFKSKDPMNLGNGYVLRPGAAKAERLYTPDDKTPAGFTQADDGTMHFTPGGPADPAYKRLLEEQSKDPNATLVLGRGGEIVKKNGDGTVTVVHKNESEAPVPMDPASLEILARREIGGDFSGRKNLGRGAQGAADLKAITNKSSEILTNEMGMTPTQAAEHLVKKQQEYNAQGQGLNAEARTTGVREANLNLILKAADAAIPAALEASDKVARTGWVPLNKIIQHGEVMTSDPDLKKFGMANLQLAEHWARAMNPTGVLREQDRDIALSFLSTADSKETYKAAVGQLRTQIERERDAVKSTRGMSDLPGSVAATHGATSAASTGPLPSGWSVQVH